VKVLGFPLYGAFKNYRNTTNRVFDVFVGAPLAKIQKIEGAAVAG
jgi:hypothetical protein